MDRINGYLTPSKKKVFVKNLEHGELRRKSGLIIKDDNMTDRGIRARWCEVFRVGADVDDLVPGEWVYVQHGRWAFGITLVEGDVVEKIWLVDYPDAILLVADRKPDTE